jgi:hypothetical protein
VCGLGILRGSTTEAVLLSFRDTIGVGRESQDDNRYLKDAPDLGSQDIDRIRKIHKLGHVSPRQFQEVTWKQVYGTLSDVPVWFKIRAAKGVTITASVHKKQAVCNKRS